METKELVVVKHKQDGALVTFKTSLVTAVKLMDRRGTFEHPTHQQNIKNAVKHHLLAVCSMDTGVMA